MSPPIGAGPLAPGVVAHPQSTLRMLAGIIRDPLGALPQPCYEQRMVLTRNAGRARAYISDPALIHEAIVRNADRLAKSESTKRVLGAALGDGLLTSDGPTWRWQRQALAPAFQHERLMQLVPAMIGAAERTRDRFLAQPRGATVDVGHEMMHTTFAIILDTMLSGPEGLDAANIERCVTDFLGGTSWMLVLAIIKAPLWTPFPGRTRAIEAARTMRGAVRDRIVRRRSEPASEDGPRDLIGMLLAARDPESGRSMGDDEIVDNILTFIAAGHETTAVALTWTFALLADRQDCLDRMQAEIEEVTGGAPIAPQHIMRLTYVKQVANEAMRMFAPAPMIVRAVTKDVEIAGVTLPAESLIVVPVHAVHHHRKVWRDPEVFDPDRFGTAESKDRHRYAFMPFGAGPRVCIGSAFATMEAVAILAVLVRALRLKPTEAGLPKPQMRITLRPATPVRMRVSPH